MIKRIDRYVFSECLGPVAIGFLVSTILLLVRSFFDLAEAMIRRDVPFEIALKLLALNLPHIVVITIPMALLFGILAAVGRLSADSELTAMRAAGTSLISLYRPILTLSILLTITNTYLSVYALPWGNRTLQAMVREHLMQGDQSLAVEPRIFNDIVDGRTMYVFESDPVDGHWNGVFFADAIPLEEFNYTVARSGDIEVDREKERVLVHLENALDQKLDLTAPDEAQLSLNKELTLAMESGDRDPGQVASKSLRELGLAELRAYSRNEENPQSMRITSMIEIHKKFSIPFACLVFGLIALPMGFANRGRGGASAFSRALPIILTYYILQSLGDHAATEEWISPAVAMWGPNVLFLFAGVFLLVRRNGDKGTLIGGLIELVPWHAAKRRLARLGSRLRPASERLEATTAPGPQRGSSDTVVHEGGGRRPGDSPASASAAPRPAATQYRFRLQLPEFSIRFPGRMDRYVLRTFCEMAAVVIASCVTIYIIVDLSQTLDEIFANDIGAAVVLEYYIYSSLNIFYTIAPFAVLLTTLICYGLLSRTSEVIAAKAAGISLYRLAIPAIFAGAAISLAAAVLDLSLLPAANSRHAQIRAQIFGQGANARRRVSRQWFFSQHEDGSGTIFNYLTFNPQRRTLQRFQAFRFDPDHNLVGHLYGQHVAYIDDSWWLENGWARSFENNRVSGYNELTGPVQIDMQEDLEFFSTEIKKSVEMSYFELRDYVTRVIRSGQKAPDLEFQLYNKLAMPAVSLVMVFVALPFAFRLGKQGALYGVGLSLLIGMVLFAVLAVFATLGETAAIPPAMAAWSPSVLFSLLSAYLFLGVRS